MKFLIHSNGPHVSTGYGVQTKLLAERLKAAGHDVAISCTYGQQGQVGTWRGIKLYPAGYETNGNDVLHNHAMHHFAGDPANGWIITLLDVWVLVNPMLKDFNIAAWCPVDHDPAPRDVMEFFYRTDAVPVAMSEFGGRKLAEQGLEPTVIPLAVDTQIFKPSPTVKIGERIVTGRQLIGVPDDAFVVGMVAMNKGWHRDRKGFNEAFRAFGQFWRDHQEAVLYVHTDWPGLADGFDLKLLATHCAIPEHAIVFPDLYAYKYGFSPEQMAAVYTAFDVLLAPSHGEGFCVPLIEAQACGTPVIASDFSAQPELIGAGWPVIGQLEWDAPQKSSYIVPYVVDIMEKLEFAYVADRKAMAVPAMEFAARYDADRVFNECWTPFIRELTEPAQVLPLDREWIPPVDAVAVLIPVMQRPENVAPLVESFNANAGKDATLYFVCDDGDQAEIDAVTSSGAEPIIGEWAGPGTFAQKLNLGFRKTTEPWVFVCGDDVRFHGGWLDAARKLSDRFDVIGTNDTTGAIKNLDVAAGRHADHFFVRRAYVDEYGACLDGPGVLAPEAYRHWFTDKEIIQLAKARGVFTPCLASVVEHLHPGYDGREDLRKSDPVYRKAAESAEQDQKTFLGRVPLIEMQRTSRAKVS